MKMPVILFIFFSVGLLIVSEQAQAKNGWPACPSDGSQVEVYVEVDQGKLSYRDGYSSKQLSALSGRTGRRLGPAWTVNGLTNAKSFQDFNASVSLYDLGHGRYCAALKQVNLKFGFKSLTVYLPRKYRRGSCEYESVLAHENQHVQIFRDVLYRHSKQIEGKLRKYAFRMGPSYARSPQAAENQIYKTLSGKMKPLFRRMQSESRRRNASIDTKTNYRREDKKCQNW